MKRFSLYGGLILALGIVAFLAYTMYLQTVNGPIHTGDEKYTPENIFMNSENDVVGRVQSASVSGVSNGVEVDATLGSTKEAPAVTDAFTRALERARSAFAAREYDETIAYYKEAATYQDNDVVHAGMYQAYLMKGDTMKALYELDATIAKNPSRTEYYMWKLAFFDEVYYATNAELEDVYATALASADTKTKVNVVITFARIMEEREEIARAIELWEYAAELYPENATTYHAEADMLRSR